MNFTEQYWVGQVKNARWAVNIYAEGRGEMNVTLWREKVGDADVDERIAKRTLTRPFCLKLFN